MKKVIIGGILVLFCSSLLACAPASTGEATKVKCPACGYEFEVPAPRP